MSTKALVMVWAIAIVGAVLSQLPPDTFRLFIIFIEVLSVVLLARIIWRRLT